MTTTEKAQLHLVLRVLKDADRTRVSDFMLAAFDKVDCVLHSDVSAALEEVQGGRVLVLIETPMRDVARRLLGGLSLHEAVEAWARDAEALLAACRPARRRIRLLAWDPLLAGDRASVDALAELVEQTVAEVAVSADPEAPDAMMQLMAGIGLQRQDSETLHQIEGLLAGPHMQTGLHLADQALNQVRAEAKAQADAQGKLDELARESTLLRQSLEDMQALMKSADADAAKEHAAQIETLQSKLAKQEKQFSSLKTERELLRAGLKAAEAETAKCLETEAAIVDQAAQIEVLQTQLSTMKDLQAERDLLRTSLHGLRQELDVAQMALQRSEDRLLEMQMISAANDALTQRAAESERRRVMSASALGAVLLSDGTRLRDVQGRLNQAEAARKTVEQALELTQTDLETQKQAFAMIEAAKQQVEQALMQAQTELEAQEQVLAAAEAAHHQQSQEYATKLAERETDIQNLTAELDKIYGSKSWRVTAPMRSARSKISKGTP